MASQEETPQLQNETNNTTIEETTNTTTTTELMSQSELSTNPTTTDISMSVVAADTAAMEAAALAKAAAEAAVEAAKRAEELAAEALKIAEAAAAEKLRLEEEIVQQKIKEFVDVQSELYRDIYSKLAKVNTQVCLRLEEIVSKDFLSMDDFGNSKLKEALKDLNENCTSAFDDYIRVKELNASNVVVEVDTSATTVTEISTDVVETAGEENKVESILETVHEIKKEADSEEVVNGETTVEAVEAVNGETTVESVEVSMDVSVAKPETPSVKPIPKVAANVDLLSRMLFKWKRSNKEKLTHNPQKLQNAKKDRRSVERPGPNPDKIKEILARTGYSYEISSGQRKYGGPPPNWVDPNAPVVVENATTEEIKEEPVETTDQLPIPATDEPAVVMEEGVQATADETSTTKKDEASFPGPVQAVPPPGCECFVGKLPRDLFEDELIPVFEKYGRIWDLRLMIDPSSGFSKGYCFVTYCEKSDAVTASKALNDFEVRPGKEMRVNISVANIKLFIGNIPKTKSKEELKEEFNRLVEGLTDVIIYHQGETTNDKVQNRGFCFLEFIDHKSASVAKRKLGSSRFNRVFQREVAVDWADPNDEPDEETMAKVKVLYVKNLSAEVTEEEVQKVFEAYGKLERVRKMKDYAFVHFDTREDAVKAMEEQNTKVIGKTAMDISLARPLTEKKKQAQQKRMEGGRAGQHMVQNNNQHWNANGNNFNQNNRQHNNRGGGFQNGGGNRGGNHMNKMNGQNGNWNNGNRQNNFGGGMQNGSPQYNRGGHMGGRGGGGFNQNRGGMNGNNFNQNNNGFNNQRGGGGGMNRGRGNFQNNNRGGNMGGNFNGNNGHQMMNKRKNNDNFMNNGDNGQKKGRFNNNVNGNGQHFNGGNNSNGNGQLQGQNFAANGNGNWNSFGGMQQQGNDASNEFYQDNFSSNQWQ